LDTGIILEEDCRSAIRATAWSGKYAGSYFTLEHNNEAQYVGTKDEQAPENDHPHTIGKIGHHNERPWYLSIIVLPGISLDNMDLRAGGKTLAEVVDVLGLNFDGIERPRLVDKRTSERAAAWANFQNRVLESKIGTHQELFNDSRIT
jgi:hypothetical protein